MAPTDIDLLTRIAHWVAARIENDRESRRTQREDREMAKLTFDGITNPGAELEWAARVSGVWGLSYPDAVAVVILTAVAPKVAREDWADVPHMTRRRLVNLVARLLEDRDPEAAAEKGVAAVEAVGLIVATDPTRRHVMVQSAIVRVAAGPTSVQGVTVVETDEEGDLVAPAALVRLVEAERLAIQLEGVPGRRGCALVGREADQHLAATWVAARLNRPLLVVSLGDLEDSDDVEDHALDIAVEARARCAVVYLRAGESSGPRDARIGDRSRRYGPHDSTTVALVLSGWNLLLVDGRIEGEDDFGWLAILPKIKLPDLGLPARRRAIAQQTGPEGLLDPTADLGLLTAALTFDDEQELVRAVRSAHWTHVLAGGASEDRIGTQALIAAFAAARPPPPGTPVSMAGPPTKTLASVVLPESHTLALRRLVAAARTMPRLLSEWGLGEVLPYGRGVTALFSGPPGTGKTIAVEAVAGELGQPLRRVSGADLRTKWYGDTEQKIRATFVEARASGAVLLFDEADGMFGRRGGNGGEHDDRALVVMLEELERHEGVVILATNRPDALDPALDRRMLVKLDFPLPDRRARSLIWRGLLPSRVPGASAIDVDALAEYPLSGGQIKNAAQRALLRAMESMKLTQEVVVEEARTEATRRGSSHRPLGFTTA